MTVEQKPAQPHDSQQHSNDNLLPSRESHKAGEKRHTNLLFFSFLSVHCGYPSNVFERVASGSRPRLAHRLNHRAFLTVRTASKLRVG